jgi:IMP dehydrogenase
MLEYKPHPMSLWKRSYTYRDIGLVPTQESTIESRTNINLYRDSCLIDDCIPVIAAPMVKVVGSELAQNLVTRDFPVVLPRTDYVEDDLKLWRETVAGLDSRTSNKLFFSVPAKDALTRIRAALKLNNPPQRFCIDVANGFSTVVQNALEELVELPEHFKFIAGNVASIQGYKFLADLGLDAVRVGIGGGSVCSTSLQTGIGVGQASLVYDIVQYRKALQAQNPLQSYPAIIADGGIKGPGDILKALALGADFVMAGGIFAGTDETPGSVIYVDNKKYKSYAGQASMAVKGSNKNVEGVEKLVAYKGSVHDVVDSIKDGLRSGMSYLNCLSLEDLQHLTEENFVLLSEASQYERTPHAE